MPRGEHAAVRAAQQDDVAPARRDVAPGAGAADERGQAREEQRVVGEGLLDAQVRQRLGPEGVASKGQRVAVVPVLGEDDSSTELLSHLKDAARRVVERLERAFVAAVKEHL